MISQKNNNSFQNQSISVGFPECEDNLEIFDQLYMTILDQVNNVQFQLICFLLYYVFLFVSIPLYVSLVVYLNLNKSTVVTSDVWLL